MTEQIQQHILTMYKVIKKIGSGAYGHVYKIQDRKTGQILALKKNFDAFSNSTDAQRIYRQIFFLKQLQHPNIIKLLKLHKSNSDMHIYLVFQYMDIDLHSLLRQNRTTQILQEKHKKYIIYQICKSLLYLHVNGIIHRDLKPSNILVNGQCDAKLCDFGLVRLIDENKGFAKMEDIIMTDYIATRWYRAPELIMGCLCYEKEVDIWALGCMIAQIIREKPLFQGTSTTNQLQKILSWTGSPSKQDLKSLKTKINSTFIEILQTRRRPNHQEMIPSSSKQTLDFVEKMLEFNPEKRITIVQALKHPFLKDFYNEKQIQKIKRKKIELKLPFDDNTKFTVNHYRDILYKEIQNMESTKLDKFSVDEIKINVSHLGSKNSRQSREKEHNSSQVLQSNNYNNRSEILKESKLSKQNHSVTKKNSTGSQPQYYAKIQGRDSSQGNRSVSRKKGISLCSKQIKGQNYNNNRHNRSVVTTITSYSNEKYQKFVGRQSRISRKNQHLAQQSKKKNSFNSFLSSSSKIKANFL